MHSVLETSDLSRSNYYTLQGSKIPAFENGSHVEEDTVQTPMTPPHDTDVNVNNFNRLIADIKDIMGPSSGLDAADVDVAHLMERIKTYVSDKKEWGKYAFVDEAYNYTRNGVDDINSKANLLILVWSPGKGSAIHDHANAHCVVKVLSGTLRETLFETPQDGSSNEHMHVQQVTDYKPNEVSYMSDTLGLHRMENPGTEPVVSLHLYTPPYAAKFGCNVFDEDTGESHHVSMSTLYSDHGEITSEKANTC